MFKPTRVSDRPALVPDITVRMAMSKGQPEREHLLDVKTARLGNDAYQVLSNYEWRGDTHGAMDARGEQVEKEYEELDMADKGHQELGISDDEVDDAG